MKSRLLIIIGILAVLGFWISFVVWETYHSQPIELIDESTYLSSDESLQRVLDHCESQRKFAAVEIPERNADGSFNVMNLPGLSFQNSTHYIDNNTCEWENVKNDFTGRYFDYNHSNCYSDKIDPAYGVIVANETHTFNPETCEWNRNVSLRGPVYSVPFGMTQEELENQIIIDPIYIDNPNNPGELILNLDAMIQVQKILDKCSYVQKIESGEIPTRNPDGSFNVIHWDLHFFNNGTHYIDSNICNWIDSLESVTYNCFKANPMEQNWYFGPTYFDNSTHHLDVQKCEWTNKK